MKKIKSLTKKIAAVLLVGMGVTGCSLDLLPLNDVVLENFWTDKSDVQSVVAACYDGMQQSSYIKNLIVWGEVRSDNVVNGPSINDEFKDMQLGNIRTTASYTKWDDMYKVINHCNVVLKYAPEVAEKDPNYTESDLKITIAEVKAIRAITYLTLIKAFRNVPLSFEASIDDTQEFRIPATPFHDVVNALIEDLEPVKDWAPIINVESGDYSRNQMTTGRISRAAVYSILAELYLWKGSNYKLDPESKKQAYYECVRCSDKVIDMKRHQYEAGTFSSNLKDKIDAQYHFATYNIPLYREESKTHTSADPDCAKSSYYIFVERNSFESIFEITYPKSTADSDPKNSTIANLYGGKTDNGKVSPSLNANDKILQSKLTNQKDYKSAKAFQLFSVISDYRSITSLAYSSDGKGMPIRKYTVGEEINSGQRDKTKQAKVATKGSETWHEMEEGSLSDEYRGAKAQYQNWIFYRLSELVLFRAEAEIEIARILDPSGAAGDGTSAKAAKVAPAGVDLTSAQALYDDAYQLIRCVYDRSNPIVLDGSKGTQYVPAPPTDYAGYHELLMDERRREFLFEGKRYSDLIRVALREGKTDEAKTALQTKFETPSRALKIKLEMLDFLFLPYSKDQVRANPNLHQNPAFSDEESSLIQ